MQQFPDIEKAALKDESSYLKLTIYNARKVCVHNMTDTDKMNIEVNWCREQMRLKDIEIELKTREKVLIKTNINLLSYIDKFPSGALYWKK